MGDRNTISPAEASLVLHRLVTEQVPVIAVFTAGDKSAKISASGVLNHFTQEAGLVICTTEKKGPIPILLSFTHDIIAASVFRYIDDAEAPKNLRVGSSLRLEMQNGNILTIMEVRDPER
jgi:hypothetical protein